MLVRHAERLSELTFEKFPEAFRRAMVGNPHAKVPRMTVWRNAWARSGAGSIEGIFPSNIGHVNGVFQVVESGGEDSSESPSSLLQRSDDCTERWGVPNRFPSIDLDPPSSSQRLDGGHHHFTHRLPLPTVHPLLHPSRRKYAVCCVACDTRKGC